MTASPDDDAIPTPMEVDSVDDGPHESPATSPRMPPCSHLADEDPPEGDSTEEAPCTKKREKERDDADPQTSESAAHQPSKQRPKVDGSTSAVQPVGPRLPVQHL